MEIIKTAQKILFAELKKIDFDSDPEPNFNGYVPADFDKFRDKLKSLYRKFEEEVNDNLTNRSQSLRIYIAGLAKTISEIKNRIQRSLTLWETLIENPKSIGREGLRSLQHFFLYQLEIIDDTETEISKILELATDDDLNPLTNSTSDDPMMPKSKVRSNLSRVELAFLLWWLAEARLFEFDGSQDSFVKYVEGNFLFNDKNKGHAPMKHLASLLNKFYDKNSTEVNPSILKQQLLEMLQNQTLPPFKPVLEKNKRKGSVA